MTASGHGRGFELAEADLIEAAASGDGRMDPLANAFAAELDGARLHGDAYAKTTSGPRRSPPPTEKRGFPGPRL